jgi:hypothetical protein
MGTLLNMAHPEWQVFEAVPTIKMEDEPEGRVVWLDPAAEQALLDAERGHATLTCTRWPWWR